MGNLEASLGHLSWSHFAGAVLDTFDRNVANETAGGEKACSDNWTFISHMRTHLWSMVRDAWRERTGLGFEWFPYHEDAVARLYFRFRKRSDAERASFRQEIDKGKLFSQ